MRYRMKSEIAETKGREEKINTGSESCLTLCTPIVFLVFHLPSGAEAIPILVSIRLTSRYAVLCYL